MVRLTILSSTIAFLLSTSYLTSATPVPPAEQRKATIIPFAKRLSTEGRSAEAIHKRDLHRAEERNRRLARLHDAGLLTKRTVPAAARLPPYDIGVARRALREKRHYAADSLTNAEDKVYYGGMDLGTPAQTTTIDFDTGSSDLLVPTADCKNCTGPFFDPTKSSTFQSLGTQFITGFGDGSMAAGIVAKETVSIGGLSIPDQIFAPIVQATVGFDHPNAGLMGLAFPPLAQSNSTPWFFNLANKGALASNIFSFYMTIGGAKGSELCFGCLDSTKFSGQPEYFPLVPDSTGVQSLWTITVQGATRDGKIVTKPFIAMIDSGTSHIQLPPSNAAEFYKEISGTEMLPDGGYIFPCDSVKSIKSFGFKFSSETTFEIDISRFVAERQEDTCRGVISSSGTEDGQAIIGDTFMAAWYSIFDYGNMKVGFAKAV